MSNKNSLDHNGLVTCFEAEKAHFQQYLQGWKQNTDLISICCKRNFRLEAHEASLKLQKRLEGNGRHE